MKEYFLTDNWVCISKTRNVYTMLNTKTKIVRLSKNPIPLFKLKI